MGSTLIPVSPIVNRWFATIGCHLNSGTCDWYIRSGSPLPRPRSSARLIDAQVISTHISAPGRELLVDHIREGRLDGPECLLGQIDVHMVLDGPTERPPCRTEPSSASARRLPAPPRRAWHGRQGTARAPSSSPTGGSRHARGGASQTDSPRRSSSPFIAANFPGVSKRTYGSAAHTGGGAGGDVPSAWAWVMSTASIRRRPYFGNHCTAECRKLFPTSITIVLPPRGTRTRGRGQRSRPLCFRKRARPRPTVPAGVSDARWPLT